MGLVHPDALLERIGSLPRGERRLVAVAGPPGSGKSTLAQALADRLNGGSANRAAVLGMDGFHYDDRVLAELGRLDRKGAPDTFDAGGLAATLDRLRANREDEIAVPAFDRGIEIARAGAALIPRSVDVILVEGNYLLVARPPWAGLAARFDLAALVHVEEAELRRRLAARWERHGLDPAAGAEKVDSNDLPNGRFVMDESAAPDLRVDGAARLSPPEGGAG